MSKRIVTLFGLLALMAASLAAQSHLATLRGELVDPAGAPIPSTTVRVINEATGEERTSTTGSADGKFTVAALPPGPYRVEVEKT